MSKYRKAAKCDVNQPEIVKVLRKIPGVTVSTCHDDILVGYREKTYWFEIKSPDTWKRSGGLKAGTIKDSQQDLLKLWTGHYMVVWELDQILTEIGVNRG